VGWLGAVIAVLGYGFSGACMKFESLSEMPEHTRSILFNAFSPLGNSAFTAFLCGFMRLSGKGATRIDVPFEARIYAWLGALNMVSVQVVALFAMQRLGLAVGPTIWTSIGIISSFLWGVVYFRETIASFTAALLGLFLLLAGLTLAMVAPSPFLERPLLTKVAEMTQKSTSKQSHEYAAVESPVSFEDNAGTAPSNAQVPENAPMKDQEAVPVLKVQSSGRYVVGIGLAVLVGILDGAMLVPLKIFRLTMESTHDSWQTAHVFAFLETERAVLLWLGVCLAVGHCGIHACSTNFVESRHRFHDWSQCARKALVPGFLHGILWAAGNVGAIHATEYLGIAVGFPLSQLALFVALGLGLFQFKELSARPQRIFAMVGAFIAFSGSAALAASGSI